MNLALLKTLTTLAEQVAEALPGSWSVKPFPEDWSRVGAYLVEEGRKAILILGESQEYSDRNKNRLTVLTDYPKDREGHMSSARRPKITISASKTGAQIAADIERRLLPEYLPILDRELASNARWNEHESATTELADRIARLVRVKREPRETAVRFYDSPYGIFRATLSGAEVHGANDVELTLRLGAADSLKLLNLIIHGQFRTPEGDD